MNPVRVCLLMSGVALCAALLALWHATGVDAAGAERRVGPTPPADTVSRAEFEHLRSANADLNRQVAALTARLEREPAGARGDAVVDALAARVAALEGWAETAGEGAGTGERNSVSGPERRALLEQNAVQGPFSPAAGQTWENDDGIPFAQQHTDRMVDAVYAAYDQIDVVGMDCRDSACRLVYAPVDTDSDFDLATMLGTELGGVSLRIRYDRDVYGNNVAYIEMSE